MGAFQNIGINAYLKRYGLKNGLLRGIYMANPIHIVRDYENKKLLYYYHAKKYIKNHYEKYADEINDDVKYGECVNENPIWIYWQQGIENAPELVQKCIKSVVEFSERPVIKLDAKSVEKYIQLPNDIRQKYTSGKMSDAALSDLIRFSLLEHFGGTWIDATVLLTGKIPEYILESDFFAFRDTFGLIENPATISNWLLHSVPHNIIIKEAKNMAFAYWRNEEYVVDYLFTYMILQIAYERNANSCGWFPYANSDYCNGNLCISVYCGDLAVNALHHRLIHIIILEQFDKLLTTHIIRKRPKTFTGTTRKQNNIHVFSPHTTANLFLL